MIIVTKEEYKKMEECDVSSKDIIKKINDKLKEIRNDDDDN